MLRRTPATDKKAASTTIPVDAVRKTIEMFGSTSADGGYRVCIVDCAEDLAAAGANALLKVIEEPPPRSIFLIVSHAPQRVLPTIRSRSPAPAACGRLRIADVSSAIASLGAPWTRLRRICSAEARKLGEGSVRRTLELLDADKVAFVGQVRALLDRSAATDPQAVLALGEALARRDADASYELALETVDRWVSARLHETAELGAARLAPLVEVCEKIARQAREIDIYNLDRRPLVLGMFDDLADAVRRTA